MASATVPELVVATAAATPDAVAIVAADGTEVTYAELCGRARALAVELVVAGVQPGEPVGVVHPRGTDLVVAWLAVGLAGAVYVPLSPDDPPTRIAALLDQVGVHVVLSAEAVGPQRCRPGTARTLRSESAEAADGPMYVVFTSGSTGVPKGVVVPHRGVPRLGRDPEFCVLAPGHRVAFASNPMFDAATWELWSTLLAGATVVVVPPHQLLDHHGLRRLLHDRGVTHLMLTTSLFDRHSRSDPRMFGSLEMLLVGGEPLDPATVRAVLDSGAPPGTFVDVYGPTEGTTYSTFHVVRHVPADAPRIPIGVPIAGTQVAVVGEDGRIVAPGDAGELWLAGDGVALGYLDDPVGTAAKFVDVGVSSPGSPPPGRWYRTGDVVTADDAGLLDCLGRVDQQVKVYGHRIEPAEVEASLRGLAGVRAAAVVAERHGPVHRLVAFVEAATGAHLDPQAMRGKLRDALPGHLVPSSIFVVPLLPLTPNGKLDRAALGEFAAAARSDVTGAQDGVTVADGFDAVDDPATSAVAAGWRRVLGHGAFGLDDDIAEVGGDSMTVVELMTWLSTVTSVDLTPLLSSVEPLTVRRMSGYLAGRATWSSMPPVVSLSVGTGPPLALVPAGGGTIFGSRWLAAALAPHFAVAAGTAPGLDGGGAPARSVRAAARRWLADWDAAGLPPPAVVVGFSSGAVLAHELAGCLGRRGNPPALTVLIDPAVDVGVRSWARAQLERVPRSRNSVSRAASVAAHRAMRRPLPLALAVERNLATVTRHVHCHRRAVVTSPVLLLVADQRVPEDLLGLDPVAAGAAMVDQWQPWCSDLRWEWVHGTHLGAESVVGRRRAATTAAAIVAALTRSGHQADAEVG